MDQKYFEELIIEFLKIKNKNLMENFLLGLFTPKELNEIPTRVQIIKMLKKGVSQKEISKKLGVGIATVTRGSNELKLGRFKNI